MKVGVLQFFSWPERRVPLHTVYERALQRIVTMDDAGYDAVWLAEHHFTTYSVCPSVHLMALEAAHRTQRLRIGTAVSLAALYHPLRLAEEVALLDVLTGGRVNWGAGRGFERAEFEAFGVPIEETAARFREAVEVVFGSVDAASASRSMASTGTSTTSRYCPSRRSGPRPPTWVAATSLDAVSWAASMGYAILMDPHAPFAEIATKYERYCEELSDHGFGPPADTPMARLLAVAATDDEAREIARAGAAWTIGAYANADRGGVGVPAGQGGFEGDVESRIESYVEERIVWGSPARVRDKLARLAEEMHLGYLMIAPLSHDSFVRFTTDVLPHV